MNVLQALHQLLGGAHQAPTQQLGNNTPQAALYNRNPLDPRIMHADPAQFGYPADNSAARLQVGRTTNYGPVPPQLLVGASNMSNLPQGGQFNPGFTPLQAVNPPQLYQNPQFQGYNAGQGIQAYQQFNPQVRGTGFSWNNF